MIPKLWIYVCSPYRGAVETNVQNARAYCRLVYEQGGIPFAPHLLYTQFLNDETPAERDAGLQMGMEVLKHCDELWVFGTPTAGMAAEIERAIRWGKRIRRFDVHGTGMEVPECES